ncbi:hypothetical protein M9H77_34492 [Catharanthus roseus]|uniref:Uncharacterized protein n=1 Tax=Catharanthus roseus TaxID=4058 RepID=A0ACB9ZLC1_CATRO|nr:hypothetical protein M9H77_34492 [Catharanthus roseus]
MSMPRSRSVRTTSLRDPDTRFTDSEKIEGAGSWEALEWTKIDPVTRSVPHGIQHLLLQAEHVIVEGYGVVLINTDEAGTLFITNFRLLFLSEGSRNIIALGTIPLATIEKFSKIVMKFPAAPRQADKAPRSADKTPSRRLLQVIGKDMRIIVFGFRPRTKQRRAVYDALLRWTRPLRIWDLYAFASGPSRFSNTNPKVRLLNEYFRLLGLRSHATTRMIEDGSFTLSNEHWRISSLNSSYALCGTYPFALLIPKSIR